MKSVMLSIQPKWCELIASGKKTIEVRKTKPSCNVPFKCYIYCTKPTYPHEDFITVDAGTDKAFAFYGGGKVIGEFICDELLNYPFMDDDYSSCYGYMYYCDDENIYFITPKLLDEMCLEYNDLETYGDGKTLYGWHISNLKIYNIPLTLNRFYKFRCREEYNNPEECKEECKYNKECYIQLQKPPQSWCYVNFDADIF